MINVTKVRAILLVERGKEIGNERNKERESERLRNGVWRET